MLNKPLLLALTTGALVMTLAACRPSTIPPDTSGTSDREETEMGVAPGENEAVESMGDRSAYSEVPVPEGAVGAEPTEVALAAFGSTEPGEGNFEEEVELVDQTNDAALVLLTQTGLADDSVNGMRYRLEFVPEGDQWRLDWAGSQVRCQPNRGSQEWSTDLCN